MEAGSNLLLCTTEHNRKQNFLFYTFVVKAFFFWLILFNSFSIMLYIYFYLNRIPAPEGTGIFKGAVQESSGETVAGWLTHLKE